MRRDKDENQLLLDMFEYCAGRKLRRVWRSEYGGVRVNIALGMAGEGEWLAAGQGHIVWGCQASLSAGPQWMHTPSPR